MLISPFPLESGQFRHDFYGWFSISGSLSGKLHKMDMRFRSLIISMIVFIACASLISTAFAQSPPPFKDFSAKRVKAPKKGAIPKIDVQIRPETEQPAEVESSAPSQDRSSEARYGWFWEGVSPSLAEMRPGRLADALRQIAQPPDGQGVSVMRLQDLQDIATAYQAEILIATVGTKVSPALALSVIAVESSGRTQARSQAGAQGLMQLMPDTVARFDVQDPLSAGDNIRGGVAFLDLLMERFDRDPVLVLAGYNAGESAVRKAGGVPDFAETRDYVPKVLATYAVARGLCRTPPELISDGCVFVSR